MTSNRQLFILALSIFLGILFPQLAAFCKPLLMPAIFLLFTFAILQVRFSDALRGALLQRSCWIILLWQLVVLPLLVSAVLYPWHHSQWYLFAVVAMCTSSITATTALAKIFSLNDALALVVCLVGTVAMPIPLYIFLEAMTEVGADIDLSVYASRIVVFIFLPFFVVMVLRSIISDETDQAIRANTPVIVLILLMFFGLSVMDGVQELLLNNPKQLLSLVLLAFLLNLSIHAITYLGLKLLGVRDAKTACLLCAYRNMGMVAAIAGASLGDYFLIFVGVWQLPMYTLPLLLKKAYQWQQPSGSA